MTVTDIVTEYGAYYLNSGQGRKNLAKILHKPVETDQDFTLIKTDNTRIEMGSALMTRLLQPFQKDWSPTGAVTFTAAPIDLFYQKIDFEDHPDMLVQSWLGFLSSNDTDRKKWPFVKWLWEEHIMGQALEDYELNEVYKGVFVTPPTPGTAGLINTSMNGIRKIINDHITAGDTTTIATGAPSATPETWVGQIETFVESIPEQYQGKPLNIKMSHLLALRFKKGMRIKYNVNYAQESDLMSVANFPNIKVVGRASMTGDEKIWTTPKENAILGVKKDPNLKGFAVESVDRQIKVYADVHRGVGFVIPQIIWTNDRDLV